MTRTDARDENGLPICECVKAQKPHVHGDRGMYCYHKCRCAPCTAANTEYDRQANVHKKRVPMADATSPAKGSGSSAPPAS